MKRRARTVGRQVTSRVIAQTIPCATCVMWLATLPEHAQRPMKSKREVAEDVVVVVVIETLYAEVAISRVI